MGKTELEVKMTAFLKEVEAGLSTWDNFYSFSADIHNIFIGIHNMGLSWEWSLRRTCVLRNRPVPTRLEIDELQEWMKRLLSLSGCSRVWRYDKSLHRKQLYEQRTSWISEQFIFSILGVLRQISKVRWIWGRAFELGYSWRGKKQRFERIAELIDAITLMTWNLISDYNSYVESPDYVDLRLKKGIVNMDL